MRKSYVYLLSHRNGKRFKVGKANDIIQRARSFNLNDIDWDNSLGLELQSAKAALRLENILLRTFENWLLSVQDVMDDQGVLDGATEWMRSECRSRMEDFLQHVEDIHLHCRICGNVLMQQVTELTSNNLFAIAERERRNSEKLQRSEARAMLQRAEESASRALLNAALLQAKEILWRELEHHFNAGTIVGMASEGHGWNLILLGKSLDDRLWQLGLQDTHFKWPRGASGLVNSISEYQCGDDRVCVVSLGSVFYDGWPSSQVVMSALADVTAFFRSLLPVDLSHFKAIINASILNDTRSRESRERLQAFVDEHLPVLQMRMAARMSQCLF